MIDIDQCFNILHICAKVSINTCAKSIKFQYLLVSPLTLISTEVNCFTILSSYNMELFYS